MPVKNLMEDIASSTLDEVLKNNEDLKKAIASRDDIAYVLNRVPPRYFTSERGVLHGKLDELYKTQQNLDILRLVYEAIDTVMERRESSAFAGNEKIGKERSLLPHIIGSVLEESTFSIVPGVEVTLLYNGKPAPMADTSWNNPYRTNSSTRGYYHFWPSYTDDMGSKKKIPFTIDLRHPKFKENTRDIEIAIDKEGNGKSQVIPIVLLEIKEGENIDFLYGEE